MVLDDWLDEGSNLFQIPTDEVHSHFDEADDEDFNEEPPTFKGDAALWPDAEGKFDSWRYVRNNLNARLRVVVTSDFFCRQRNVDQTQSSGQPERLNMIDMVHAFKWMVPSFFPMKYSQLSAAWTSAPFTCAQIDRIENALYVTATVLQHT